MSHYLTGMSPTPSGGQEVLALTGRTARYTWLFGLVSDDDGTPASRANRNAMQADGGVTGRTNATRPPDLGPGCSLDSPAFCETFAAPAAERGRTGELDPGRWSVGRIMPQLPTAGGSAFWVNSNAATQMAIAQGGGSVLGLSPGVPNADTFRIRITCGTIAP